MGLFNRKRLDVDIRMPARVVSGQRVEAVVVVTKSGNPIANAVVRFSVSGGDCSPGRAMTDANGIARTYVLPRLMRPSEDRVEGSISARVSKDERSGRFVWHFTIYPLKR